MISPARQRFEICIKSLRELLRATSGKRDKARYFYDAHARDLIFRLEALCRLYRRVGDKKLFDPWYKEFKALEDSLGGIDHNDAMIREFSKQKRWKENVSNLYGVALKEEFGFLEDVLKGNDWLSGEKLQGFVQDLDNHEWKSNEEDLRSVAQGMHDELSSLQAKYSSGVIDTTLLEEGVHEFRRRLRWIPIYALASNGAVQLNPVKSYAPAFNLYCSQDIIKSPFNRMPRVPRNVEPIQIQSHHFYAMSWLIFHLGELKDIGLRYEAFRNLNPGSGAVQREFEKTFIASCNYDPRQVTALAEMAIDEFVHKNIVLHRVQRDLLRFIERS